MSEDNKGKVDFSLTNEEVLKRILRVIKLATESHKFILHFVECTLLTDQRSHLDYLKNQCKSLRIELVEIDLISKITRNLREEILRHLNEVFPNGRPSKLTVVITGLESSILIDANEEYPAVLQILNLGRELFDRDLPYPLIFWFPDYALKKLASVAPDFWSWRSGGFDKLVTTKEAIKEAIDEAIRLPEPSNWKEGIYQVTLFERLVEACSGFERKTRKQKAVYRELLYRLGTAYRVLEKYQKASRYYKEALKLDESLEDRTKKARELDALGHVHQYIGKFEESKGYYEQYLKLKEEEGDRRGQGIALGNIGLVCHKMGRDEEAIDYLSRARRINEERINEEKLNEDEKIRTLKVLADNIGNLGLIYQQLGDMKAAIEYHQKALSIDREINKDSEIIKDLSNLGFVHYSQGEFVEATNYYSEALGLSRKADDRIGERENLIKLAVCFRELKEFERARDYYREALDTVRKTGDEKSEYDILNYLASIYYELNSKDADQVIDCYEKALELSRKLRDQDKELHCLRKLIQLHHSKWEFERVSKYKHEACKLLESKGELRTKKINAWIIDSQDRQTENLASGREYLLCVNVGEPIKGYTPLKQSSFIYSLVAEGKDLHNQIHGTGKVSTDDTYPPLEKQTLQPAPKKHYDERTVSVAETFSLQETIHVIRRQESKSPEEIRKEETLAVPSTSEKAVEVSVRIECGGSIFDDIGSNKKQLRIHWNNDSEVIYFRLGPREIGSQRITVKSEANGIPFDDLMIDVVVEKEISEIDKAILYYEQALKIARETKDKSNEVLSLGNLGNAYWSLGEVKKAILYYEEALRIAMEIGDRQGEGRQLGNIGIAYDSLGEVNKAILYYEQALRIANEIGDRQGEGRQLGNIGIAYKNLGEVNKAISYYEQALEIAIEIGNKNSEGLWLGNLGNAYGSLGELNKANLYYEQALRIARGIGDKRNEGLWLGNIGYAYGSLGELDKAISYLEQALGIAMEIGDRQGEGSRLGNLGIVYKDLGELNKAISYFEQALRIAMEIGNKRNEGLWLYNLGVIYKDQKSNELALACFLRSAKIGKEIEDPRLSYTNKVIEDMRQTLGEEEFAKLESDVQVNLVKFLKEATGIEGWEVVRDKEFEKVPKGIPTMNEETKPRAFLCHSNKDNDLALKLGSDLRKQGVDIWIDKWEIKPGDSLRRKIDEGIENADFFFALLTINSLRSEWVATELDAALVRKISGQCTLVPIPVGISDEEIPPTLRGLVYVRLDNYEEGVRKLVGLCYGVSKRPPLGEVPIWALSVGKLNTLGISPHAEKLAILLNEKSEYGREYDPNLTADEILKQFDLSEEEIAIAADELEDLGWVHLSKTIGMSRVGFHSISPRPNLFMETDPYLKGWDPREDAKSLAAALVNTGKSSVSLSEVGSALGWEPRRINVAAQVLEFDGAIERSRTLDPVYVFPSVIVTARTRRYANRENIPA